MVWYPLLGECPRGLHSRACFSSLWAEHNPAPAVLLSGDADQGLLTVGGCPKHSCRVRFGDGLLWGPHSPSHVVVPSCPGLGDTGEG